MNIQNFDPNIFYFYKIRLRSIWDGDTIRADIDMGRGLWDCGNKGTGVAIRLAGIDSFEKQSYGSKKVSEEEKEKGKAAKQFLSDLIIGAELMVQSIKADEDGKYGRYIGILYLHQGDSNWLNVNDYMVENGHAIVEHY